jgi:REP element-mobilizing transposase RayT
VSAQRENMSIMISHLKPPYTPAGWHSRGYLPHFDGGEVPQFITFRLADSLPQKLLVQWRAELGEACGIDIDAALRKRIELYLDQGHGNCYLADPRIASLVQNSLLFFEGERYRLSAWVVMPNHAHFLVTPCPGQKLSRILHSLKCYTANEANKIVVRKGTFWQPESFDRYIRDTNHFASVIRYIESNPVKARLCARADDWAYGSAWFRARKP